MTFHGPWNEEMKIEGQGIKHKVKTTIAKSIEHKAYKLADKFIVLSEYFRNMLHELHGVPLHKITVIPGAANVERFTPAPNRLAVRRTLNLPEGATTVLTVRRLMNRMGLLQLLEAWKQVGERFPNAILLIGGKGPLRGSWKNGSPITGWATRSACSATFPIMSWPPIIRQPTCSSSLPRHWKASA